MKRERACAFFLFFLLFFNRSSVLYANFLGVHTTDHAKMEWFVLRYVIVTSIRARIRNDPSTYLQLHFSY